MLITFLGDRWCAPEPASEDNVHEGGAGRSAGAVHGGDEGSSRSGTRCLHEKRTGDSVT